MNLCSSKLRVAQMTWYQSQNYGSVLQAYALQRALTGLGAEAELVNYDPAPWQQRNQASFRKSKPFRAARVFQQRVMGVAAFTSQDKDAAFKAFAANNMRETSPVETPRDFEALNDAFDAFVCGSDQVWSPRCFDPRYFLDFVGERRLKIAYAPSFGCDELPSDASATMAPLVVSFDALSAREAQGARMVESMSGGSCEVVCDPVVLLSSDEWRPIGCMPGGSIPERYCLCYFLGRSKENWDRARAIADLKGLSLVIVPVFNGDVWRKGIAPVNIGPREFLGLVDGAAHVCTDSFHGLVFSTIFERDFTVFERFKAGSSSSQNVRIENYLGLIGLKQRLLRRESTGIDEALEPVVYETAAKTLAELRERSLRYLSNSLAPAFEGR